MAQRSPDDTLGWPCHYDCGLAEFEAAKRCVFPGRSGMLVVRTRQMSPLFSSPSPRGRGAQGLRCSVGCPWVPAFAGMAKGEARYQALGSYH
jgi:hypothetical protein